MQAWKRINPTVVTEVGHRVIVSKTFLMPDGTQAKFETYDTEGRQYVAVIGLTTDNRVVVAKQFRAGPERTMFELPGGAVESGETLISAVARELLEETGFEAKKLQYLGHCHKDEKFNAVHHYFIGFGCHKVTDQQILDQDEHIEIVSLPVADFINCAKKTELTDTHAVLLAYDTLKSLEESNHD